MEIVHETIAHGAGSWRLSTPAPKATPIAKATLAATADGDVQAAFERLLAVVTPTERQQILSSRKEVVAEQYKAQRAALIEKLVNDSEARAKAAAAFGVGWIV